MPGDVADVKCPYTPSPVGLLGGAHKPPPPALHAGPMGQGGWPARNRDCVVSMGPGRCWVDLSTPVLSLCSAFIETKALLGYPFRRGSDGCARGCTHPPLGCSAWCARHLQGFLCNHGPREWVGGLAMCHKPRAIQQVADLESTLLLLHSASLQFSFVAQVGMVVFRYAVYRRTSSSVDGAPPMIWGLYTRRLAWRWVNFAATQQLLRGLRSLLPRSCPLFHLAL